MAFPHLRQQLQRVGVGGPRVHKHRPRQAVPRGRPAHALFHAVPDKLPPGGGGLEHGAHVDGGEEGRALRPQPLELLVAGLLHVGTAAGVVLHGAPVVVVVAVGEQVKAPQLVGPQGFGLLQGLQHELAGGHLKLLLSHPPHSLCGPVGVLLAHKLAGATAIHIFVFPVPYPEWAPLFPVNDSQALSLFLANVLLHTFWHLIQMLFETGYLGQPTIHCSTILLVVWIQAQAVFIEDG